jgi:hypothetical protein
MKQDWTVRVFKLDGRMKRGERIISTTVWTYRDEEGIQRECKEIEGMYPKSKGYRVIYYPSYKTVKNLMTGADVTIETDTPRACDPSSELYWSM